MMYMIMKNKEEFYKALAGLEKYSTSYITNDDIKSTTILENIL